MDTTNLTKLDDQHWEIYFSYTDRLTGERDWVRRRFHGTHAEAVEKRDLLKEKANAGGLDGKTPSQDDDPTVGDFWESFKHDRQNHPKWKVKKSTWEKAVSKHRCHVLPSIREWRVKEIEIRDLDNLTQQWCDKLKPNKEDEKYSPATINGWIRKGRALLKYCLYKLGEPRQWLLDWKEISEADVEPAGRALSEGEADAFFSTCREMYPQWYPLVYLMRVTGQRFGTATALEWDDIDFDEGVIHFERSHWRGRVSRGTKTGQVLALPLTDNLQFLLMEHANRLGREDNEGGEKTNLVFPADVDPEKSPRNGYLGPSSLYQPLKRAGKRAGIGPVTVHDMRRTFVTRALESGISPERVQKVTGQCKRMIDAYFRSSTAGDRAVMEAAAGLGSRSGGSDRTVVEAANPSYEAPK